MSKYAASSAIDDVGFCHGEISSCDTLRLVELERQRKLDLVMDTIDGRLGGNNMHTEITSRG